METERKGRGSFVDIRRKSLTFNMIFSNEDQENYETPRHSMKTYLESLKKEKQEWKNILRETQIRLKTSENKYKFEPLIISKEDFEKYACTDDKAFLNSKLNYSEILESITKYIDSVNYLNKYKMDIVDYYNKACSELEINQKLLVDEMISDDLCEICNVKKCQQSEHKFIF